MEWNAPWAIGPVAGGMCVEMVDIVRASGYTGLWGDGPALIKHLRRLSKSCPKPQGGDK